MRSSTRARAYVDYAALAGEVDSEPDESAAARKPGRSRSSGSFGVDGSRSGASGVGGASSRGTGVGGSTAGKASAGSGMGTHARGQANPKGKSPGGEHGAKAGSAGGKGKTAGSANGEAKRAAKGSNGTHVHAHEHAHGRSPSGSPAGSRSRKSAGEGSGSGGKKSAKSKSRGSHDSNAKSMWVPAPVERPDTAWDRYFRQLQGVFSKMRYLQAFLDTYEAEGWRRANLEKIKPMGEILRAKRGMVDAKRRIRAILQCIDEEGAEDTQFNVWGPDASPLLADPSKRAMVRKAQQAAAHGEDDTIDAEEVACSRCGRLDADDDDDILLCDFEGCGLAYHMKCLDPPVDSLPGEDEDWVCHRCACIVRCITSINDEWDCSFDRYEEVFEDVSDEERELAAEEGAWMAREEVRLAPLRAARRGRANSDASESDAGADGDEGTHTIAASRPKRAAAAAASVMIRHELDKREKAAARASPPRAHSATIESNSLESPRGHGGSAAQTSPRGVRIKTHGLVVDERGRVVSPATLPSRLSPNNFSPRKEPEGPQSLLEALLTSDDDDEEDEYSTTEGTSSSEGSAEEDGSSVASAHDHATPGKRRRSRSDAAESDAGEDEHIPLSARSASSTRGARSARLRSRPKVDYIALNAELFGGGGAMSGEDAAAAAAMLDEEDDEDFVPKGGED